MQLRTIGQGALQDYLKGIGTVAIMITCLGGPSRGRLYEDIETTSQTPIVNWISGHRWLTALFSPLHIDQSRHNSDLSAIGSRR